MMTKRLSYAVYIKVDASRRIDAINSSAFLPDVDGWAKIDEGMDDRYKYSQNYYFPKFTYDDRGIHRYMTAPVTDEPDREAYHVYEYEGETWGIYERTQAEMDADWVEPVPQPDQKDQKIAELENRVAALSAAFLQL